MRPDKKVNRIGEINYNKYGSKMIIIEYTNTHHIKVQFENGYTTTTNYFSFEKGKVKSVYDKTLYNIGYMGEGKYSAKKNKEHTKQYEVWIRMLDRCYDEKNRHKCPSYKGCTVSKEWHNFQSFAKWYDENYYGVDEETIELDKDILVKGNKIYSPDTCMFVPNRINTLFINRKALRGKYPIGVDFHKHLNKFRVRCDDINGKPVNLGYYLNVEEAFNVYKKYKEKVIKDMADKYKDKIPEKLYDAMYKYKVEITD